MDKMKRIALHPLFSVFSSLAILVLAVALRERYFALSLGLFIVALVLVGWTVARDALRGLLRRDFLDEKFLIMLIEDFLNSVSDVNRNIFICRYWYCENISQIAKKFSLSKSKVTTILYRMRLKLRVKLEKEGIVI